MKKIITISLLAGFLAVFIAAGFTADKKAGYLGVSTIPFGDEHYIIKDLDFDLDYGVYVMNVYEGTPAAKAGLESGDIITHIDGKKITSREMFTDYIEDAGAGAEVKLSVLRDKKKKELAAKLAEKDGSFDFEFDNDFLIDNNGKKINILKPFKYDFFTGRSLGIKGAEMNKGLAEYFDTDKGVLVLSVNKDSAAEKCGIKEGDIITAINGKEVSDIVEIHKYLRRVKKEEEVKIELIRKGDKLTKTAKIEDFKGHEMNIKIFGGDEELPMWIEKNAKDKARIKADVIIKDAAEKAKIYAYKFSENSEKFKERYEELEKRFDEKMKKFLEGKDKELKKLEERLKELEKKLKDKDSQ